MLENPNNELRSCVLVASENPRQSLRGSFVAGEDATKTSFSQNNTVSVYRYDPLPLEPSIRRITIHPGSFNDAISITIAIMLFDTREAPEYEALSYAWGSQEDMTSVSILDSLNSHNTILSVTSNLDTALRHLRYPDKPRYMWIDAICINQADKSEKGTQVIMMGDIFRLACRVVAWLGPEADNSSYCLSRMEQLGSQVEVNYETRKITPAMGAIDPGLGDRFTTLAWNTTDLFSLYCFLRRPWFNRLWVRQEILLANQYAIVMCGNRTILWQLFRRAWVCVCLKKWIYFDLWKEFRARLRHLRPFIYHPEKLSLQYLWYSILGTTCSDPRDRIYAVISLLDGDSRAMIKAPDYKKRTREVYRDIVTQFIRQKKSLDILQGCEFGRNPFGPSWIPTWSEQLDWTHAKFFSNQSSSGQIQAWWDTMNPRPDVLRVAACFVGTVQATQPILKSSIYITLEEAFKPILKIFPRATRITGPYVGGGSCYEAYIRALCSDKFQESYYPPDPDYPNKSISVEILKRWISGEEDRNGSSWGDTESKLLLYANTLCDNQPLLRLTTGHIGTASHGVKLGDEVFVLLGSSVSMVLRMVESGRYIVVGPCYICGIGEGQTLLGPLPDHIQPVNIMDDSAKIFRLGFRDKGTGNSCQDIRYEPLEAANPSIRGILEEDVNSYLHISPKDLRMRGVDVRMIELE